MDMLAGALITSLFVLLILYLLNPLPMNRRAREIILGVPSLPGHLVNF